VFVKKRNKNEQVVGYKLRELEALDKGGGAFTEQP
jgi:hypothetical protein